MFWNKKEKLIDKYEIDNNQFDLMKDKAILIDVRGEGEYRMLKRIPNCRNIPHNELIANFKNYLPDKNETIITICNAGNRSTDAALFLREAGYKNTFVLKNGIYGYK